MFAKLRLTATAIALVASSGIAQAQDGFISIGTGGLTGVYYPTGGGICRLVNLNRKEHGVRCLVESTDGSVYNTEMLREGELDFAVVQSDVHSDAVRGTGAFDGDGAYGDLRALFSVHTEPLQVMVRADAGIASVMDMKGKRVNIGNPGSGTRVLAEILLQAAGVGVEDLALAGEFSSADQAEALCDGELDAAIWAAGVPNGATLAATSTCKVLLLDLSSSGMDEILAAYPDYSAATIPGGLYPGNLQSIDSWGTKATFVTDAATPDEVVYTVVKAVFENLDRFRGLHPAFARLRLDEMVHDGLTAPLHPAAAKYFDEAGLR